MMIKWIPKLKQGILLVNNFLWNDSKEVFLWIRIGYW